MENLYFTEELMKKLKTLTEYPLSVLEAPAGYGKTIAVHRVLDERNERVLWYTAVESMQDTSFRWFIRQIGKIDADAARELQDLGFLNRSNAAQAAQIISEIRAEEPVFLVFDNFQFSIDNWQPQILNSLAGRDDNGLHIIFISQHFGRFREMLRELESSICYIRSQDLLLTEEDIRNYAAQLRVQAGEEEIHEIYQKTDGWAAAVTLYLQNMEEGSFRSGLQDMDDLLYNLFWDRLSDKAQQYLLSICLFDHISEEQLKKLLPESLREESERQQLLRRIPLIRYHERKKDYYPHEILLTFLRRMLMDADRDFRYGVFRKSGDLFNESGMLKEAVICYWKAEDYEKILACRLVCLITEDIDGISYSELAGIVLRECPEEIQRQYPLSLLRLCYALYAGCQFGEFDRQMERIRPYLEEREESQLLGEWHLLNALSGFPDLEKMEQEYLLAEKYMDGPSAVFVKEEPYMFGCTSMWYLFYSKPGAMMETADVYERVLNIYNRLTDGHGAGAAELYRGEALSVQGLFEESDIQAYRAAFLSEQSGNASVTYGVALLLGINAIYRADMIGLQKAVDYLENRARGYDFLQGKMLNTYMVETVRGYLLGLMMETGSSPLWTQGEADALSDLTFTNFMIKTCRITDMLLKKEYKRAIASVESSLGLEHQLISTPTRNFMYCGLALCYLAIAKPFKAADYLDQALTLAGADRNYTFIACFRKYFQVLFLMPKIAARHGRTIREIKALDIRYTRADETRIFAVLDEDPELTQELTRRELEVAELAAEGMRNAEIAEHLHISENTVKHHLKIVFQKMNIDRRSKLVEMLR